MSDRSINRPILQFPAGTWFGHTSAFELQPMFIRHPRRFGLLTRFWLMTGLAYQLDQALQGILPVAFTDAKTVGLERENTCIAHPAAGEVNQSPLDGYRTDRERPMSNRSWTAVVTLLTF